VRFFEAAIENRRDSRNPAVGDRHSKSGAVVDLGKTDVAIRKGRVDRAIGRPVALVGQHRVRVLEIDLRNQALAGPEVVLTEEQTDRRRTTAAASVIATDKKQARTEAESTVAQQTKPRSHIHLAFERRITLRASTCLPAPKASEPS